MGSPLQEGVSPGSTRTGLRCWGCGGEWVQLSEPWRLPPSYRWSLWAALPLSWHQTLRKGGVGRICWPLGLSSGAGGRGGTWFRRCVTQRGTVCSVGSVLAECSLEAPVQAYGATGAQGLELLMWVRHLGRRDFCSLSSW